MNNLIEFNPPVAEIINQHPEVKDILADLHNGSHPLKTRFSNELQSNPDWTSCGALPFFQKILEKLRKIFEWLRTE